MHAALAIAVRELRRRLAYSQPELARVIEAPREKKEDGLHERRATGAGHRLALAG